jgi:hypothetical protein
MDTVQNNCYHDSYFILPALKHMNYKIYMKNLGKIKRHGVL